MKKPVQKSANTALAFQRKKYSHLTDDEFRFMVQQEEGRERLRDKLPAIVQQSDWWFPPRLACEQCSSELTAAYKTTLIAQYWGRGRLAGGSPASAAEGGSHEEREMRSAHSPVVETEEKGLETQVGSFIDLTGGYGIDSFYLSALAAEAHYVEQDTELCRIASHNFALARPHIQVHNTTAEAFLSSLPAADNPSVLIYLDPARRDTRGGKVFRIEDCTPNVIDLLPQLLQKSTCLMIKLSPMLDITAALRSLAPTCRFGGGWQVHVVAVRNEVKELLFVRSTTQPQYTPSPADRLKDSLVVPSPFVEEVVGEARGESTTPSLADRVGGTLTPSLCREGGGGASVAGGSYTAANYTQDGWQTFTFTLLEEHEAQPSFWNSQDTPRYLYEPNAAILKAAAFRLVSERYRVAKLAPNTHLYAADRLLPDFPGRVWEVLSSLTGSMLKHLPDAVREQGAAILTRNYPLTADQLRKKLKLKDGSAYSIIAARVADKPAVFLARRV
ncbi:MAG: hypothetical protein ACI4BD_07915 [Paludibacteraceae bacterium]